MSSPSRFARWRPAILWISGFALFSLFVILNTDLYMYMRYLTLALPQGAIIALMAVGYSMVYGIIQLINFAHGEVFMFSTYFMLMLLVPSLSDNPIPMQIMSGCIGALVACTAWVLLSAKIISLALRVTVSVVIGAIVAIINYQILPSSVGATMGFWMAMVVAVAYSCCLGVTMDVVAYRPLRDSPRLIPLITALGMSLLLQNVAQSVWGSGSRVFPTEMRPDLAQGGPDHAVVLWKGVGENASTLTTTTLDVAIIALALFLLISLQWFINKTRTGKALRACAQDRTTASLMGIQANRMVALAFALGASLAALAAPFYVLRGTNISPTMGYIVGILAFSSAVLGGIGNITGAMLGGLVIGIIYSFVPLFDTIETFALFRWMEARGWVSLEQLTEIRNYFGQPGQYQLGVAYTFMVIVIVLKPTGLMGKATARRA